MSRNFFLRCAIAATLPFMVMACASEPTPAPPNAPAAETTTTPAAAEDTGTLEIRANGEDFVRQGFLSKDGWQLSFDHVYVTLAEVTAYQSDPPFDANVGGTPQAKNTARLDEVLTVDLAAGDETAEPVLVKALEAPVGRYNALSWKMVPAPTGPAAGYTLMIQGTAKKDGQTLPFTLKLDPTLAFVCGDYVGDERKGILTSGAPADLEATFHFDHLFGDGKAAPDDDINKGALGFAPFAALAQGKALDIDMAGLKAQLSPADYDLMMSILPSLGHVGEGHCKETELTSRS